MIDPNSPPVVTNDPTVSSTPAATPAQQTAAPTTGAAIAPTSPQAQVQQSQNDGPQTQQPNLKATIAEKPLQSAPVSTETDPAIQHAGRFYRFAEALAGGPRYTTSIDPNSGATTRTPVKLSKGDLSLALAMEAISGGLAGLSQRGPGATGRAGEAEFQQVSQERQQAQQEQEAQVQQDNQNQSNALARRAQIYEANSRALLNTSEAEQRGADAIDKLVSINRQSGVLDVDPALLDNAGQPMTQDELMDAMKAGKLSPTDQVGPIAGRIEMTNPDGSKRWEATHLVVRDPSTPVSLTQEGWDRYAAAGVPGYPAGTKIGRGLQVKLSMKQSANEIMASHYLANQRLSDLHDVLDGTQYAKQVPASIDFTKPGVETAIQRFQKYVSHNAANLQDPYAALQDMGTDKRDPKTGEMQPNPDAKYVSTVADALGGWSTLEAAHDQIAANKKTASDFAVIDSADKANAVLAAPKRFTPDKVQSAKAFISLSNQQGAQKASQDARARAVAEGTDVQAMYRFGRNPVTGEVLSLDNAPPSMLVDPSGNVIPQDMVSTYKPTAQERQTADTARQVLAISADLQSELQKNPNLAGPLSGRSKSAIAKLGYGDAQAQKFLDDISFLQSAATKMHTGRFSNEILKKMSNIVQPGMNPDQFGGALSSINSVASRYADEDRLRTVSDYKSQTATPMNPSPAGGRQVQIPVGAQIGRDGKGNIVGYKLPNGQFVSVGGNQ